MPSGNRIIHCRGSSLEPDQLAPILCDVKFFTNQVFTDRTLTKGDEYNNDVYILPKHLDEKVARLHLDRIGVKLTTLAKDQADYIASHQKAHSSLKTLQILNATFSIFHSNKRRHNGFWRDDTHLMEHFTRQEAHMAYVGVCF